MRGRTFHYRRRTAGDIFLHLLNHAVEDDTYASVLLTLGKGIKAAVDRIDKAEREGPEDFAEAVTDQETEIVEGLLGMSCVLCQTQITAVTQAGLKARKQAVEDGMAFNAFGVT